MRESQARLAGIVESSDDAIISKTFDGTVLTWNKSAERIFGYSAEEIVGQNISILFPPERASEEVEIIEKIKRGERIRNFETVRLKKDGTRVPVSLSHSPIKNSNGEIIAISKIAHDLTKQKSVESALKASETRFRQLVEASIIGIIIADLNGTVIEANDVFLEITGYDRAELSAGIIRLREMTPPEQFARDDLAIKELTESGDAKPREKEYIRKDGTRVPVLVGGTLLKDPDNTTLAFVLDISDQKRIAEELRQLNLENEYQARTFNTLLYSISDMTFTFDREHRFRYANKPVLDLYGKKLEELIGKNFSDLNYPEELTADIRQNIQKVFDTGESVKGETRFPNPLGEIGFYEYVFNPVISAGGNVEFVVGSARDITERKIAEEALRKSEEQLQQSQKLESIGQLAGGIAHDFNNMLTAINGYSELGLRILKSEDPLRRNLEEIKKAGERAAGLTRQLLAFSRKQVLQPKVLNINSVVFDFEKMLQRLIGEHIDLQTILEPAIGNVKADPGQIEQVIMNLVVNARDAMPDGGKLTIETKNVHLDDNYIKHHISATVGSYVMLAVSDNGTGMNEETRKQIFEPFFTTKKIGEGTGLGLSTVYGIIKQSGGNIWVYSEPGHGTSFKIYLPRVDAEAEPYKRSDKVESTIRGTETILLVEDEEIVRKFTREVLDEYGYKVLEAANGDSALLISEQHQGNIHLVISDVIMPQMNGRDLVQKLLRLRPEMKVLYMSGYTDNSINFYGVLDEGTNFIQKPFVPTAIAQKIREILDN